MVREVRSQVAQSALNAVDARLPRIIQQQRLARARAEAEASWQELRTLPVEQQRSWVDQNSGCCTPAFVARVCTESERAAAHRADRTLALSQLAYYIAEHAPDEVREKCKAYAKGFIANAYRVGGQLHKADIAYSEAFELWESNTTFVPALNEALFLDLGASLRLAQRRFDDALALQDRALALVGSREGSYILLNRSHVQHASGQYESSLETLQQAAAQIDPQGDARSWFAVQFNRAANLSRLGRHQEAQELLPEIWDLVESIRGDLHLLRLRWLAAEITAGLGDSATAVRSLEDVRKLFADQGNPFDAALASLDLAEIYLKQANTSKVRLLAEEMIKLFHGEGVQRETLAAILLFREAVEREEATVDLIRRLAQFLREAREDPSHHFER